MTKANTCTVPDSLKCLRAPVKITGNRLAAGCQLFYCKIYGYFLQCMKRTGNPTMYEIFSQPIFLGEKKRLLGRSDSTRSGQSVIFSGVGGGEREKTTFRHYIVFAVWSYKMNQTLSISLYVVAKANL